ncbi:MAG: hypothetical protein VKN60_06120 [Cyanobacteriota bacterium]|nr:hypothetical protein [Cyanobacteriota bacterium]
MSLFPQRLHWLEVLGLSGALALAAGAGLGLALRSSADFEQGPLRSEQSFPPQGDWPVAPPSSLAGEEKPE